MAVNKTSLLYPQFVFAILCNVQSISFGLTMGWLAPLQIKLESAKSPIAARALSSDEISWLGSAPPLSILIATPIFGFLLQRFGCKITSLLSNLLTLSSFLILLASPALYIAYLSRILAGFGAAGAIITIPIYISECVDEKQRGFLCGLSPFFINIGVAIAYVSGVYLSYLSMTLICLSFPICFAMFYPWLPKTPAYVFQKSENPGNRAWFRGALISCLILTTQQLSGISPISTYFLKNLKDFGSTVKVELSALVVGSLQLLATLLGPLALKWIGRRPLLLYGGLAMSLNLFLLLAYLIFPNYLAFGWFPLVAVCGFIFAYSLGYGLVPFVLIPEILNPQIKGIIAGVCGIWVGMLSFVIIKCYPFIIELLSMPTVYAIFACCSLAGTLVVHVLMFETKGRTFDEIQRLLSRN